MNLTMHIPDDLAIRWNAAGGDLSRRALEALAVEEYKHDRLTTPELQKLLGIETSFQLDEFLKAHDVSAGTSRLSSNHPREHAAGAACASPKLPNPKNAHARPRIG